MAAERKGFTLAELVVVLVIISLLAAITVPGLFGQIDEMYNRSYINDARIAVTSAQSELMDVYQSGKNILSGNKKQKWVKRMEYDNTVKMSVACSSGRTDLKSKFIISEAVFTKDGVSVYYNKGEYTVVDTTPADLAIVMTADDDSTIYSRGL